MREKSLNPTRQSHLKSSAPSFRTAIELSAYTAIFYGQSSRPSERNRKKTKTLPRSTQHTDQKLAANSLFQNILRVSHSGSIFCPECRRSTGSNIHGMSILQTSKKKMNEPTGEGSVNDSGATFGQQKGGPKAASSQIVLTHKNPGPFYARGKGPCWKWYCRILAASAGVRVLPLRSTVRTTSPRQTTSVAERPAISCGSTRLISS